MHTDIIRDAWVFVDLCDRDECQDVLSGHNLPLNQFEELVPPKIQDKEAPSDET
jgi:hypothetical protein